MHCKSTALTDEIQAILLTLILANLHHFFWVTGFGPTFLISFFFGGRFSWWFLCGVWEKTHPKLQNQICWAIIFLRKQSAQLVLSDFHRNLPVKWHQAKGARPWRQAIGHRGSLDTSDTTGHTRTSSPRGLPSWDDCTSGSLRNESLGGSCWERDGRCSKAKTPTFWSDHHAHVFSLIFFL